MLGTFKQARCDLENVHYVGKLNTQQDGNQATLFTVAYDGVVGFVCPRWMDVLEQCTPVQRLVTMRNVRGGDSLHAGPESEVVLILPPPNKATSPVKNKAGRRRTESGFQKRRTNECY